MTRSITRGNRGKATVESSDGRGDIYISRNHEGGFYGEGPTSRILNLYSTGKLNLAFDLDQAIQIRDAITEVILDAEQIIEAAKPKALTFDELTALETGTRVYNEAREYIKTSESGFVKIKDDSSFNSYLPLGFIYSPNALNGNVYAEEVK